MFDKYDKDIKQMALYMADACHTAVQWDSCVSKDQKLCTINVQPYIFFILICALTILQFSKTLIKNQKMDEPRRFFECIAS